MAELNLNYEPAWLQQRPDSNQPMSLAEAFQLKQRQQQLDIEKSLLPLRQQEMQAQIANAALDHTLKQEQVDVALKAKSADAAVWKTISEMDDASDPASWKPVYEQLSRTPWISPGTRHLIEETQKSAAEGKRTADRLQTALDIANLKLSMPQKETALQDAIDNQIRDENTVLTAQGKPPMTPAELAQRRSELRANAPILGGGKEATQVFDVNGNLMFSQTKGGGMPQGITPGLQTTAQKEILSNKKAFDIAHDLEASLDPSSVGAVGVINNLVFDKALSQIDPSLANNKRIDDRTKLITARNQIVRLINSDSRFSALDRQEAEQALPSPGIIESYPNVQQKLKTLQAIFKRRSYQDSVSQGVPPPYWSMPTQDEVVAMFKKKKAELQRAVQENKMKSAAANAAIMREMADAQEVLEEQYGIPPRPQAPTP
jgi:hypothetical protein